MPKVLALALTDVRFFGEVGSVYMEGDGVICGWHRM